MNVEFILSRNKSADLATYKQNKIDDLNEKCNSEILAGFNSSALGTPHFYDFSYESQINLAGVKEMFNFNTNFTSIPWRTDQGDIPHTKDQFITMWTDGFMHKMNNVQKYKALKIQVDDVSTNTQDLVNAIIW